MLRSSSLRCSTMSATRCADHAITSNCVVPCGACGAVCHPARCMCVLALPTAFAALALLASRITCGCACNRLAAHMRSVLAVSCCPLSQCSLHSLCSLCWQCSSARSVLALCETLDTSRLILGCATCSTLCSSTTGWPGGWAAKPAGSGPPRRTTARTSTTGPPSPATEL